MHSKYTLQCMNKFVSYLTHWRSVYRCIWNKDLGDKHKELENTFNLDSLRLILDSFESQFFRGSLVEEVIMEKKKSRILRVWQVLSRSLGFPGGSVVKNPPVNARHLGSITGSGRSSGEENGNPFQYSCLGNPMDRGAWWATVHELQESAMTYQLNNNKVDF